MNTKAWPVWVLTLSMLSVGVVSSLVVNGGAAEAIRFGRIYSPDRGDIFHQLLMRADTSTHKSSRQYEVEFRKVISPSYAVYRLRGLSLLDSSERYQRRDYRTLEHVQEVATSSNSDQIGNLTDGQGNTRWFAGGGRQSGNEWIFVKFQNSIELEGVELSTGQFVTDYPRAIAVYGGSTCGLTAEETMEQAEMGEALFRENDWQGPVLFTAAGLPYFGTQNYVRPVLASPVKTTCLLIKQTRQDAHYDWSVAELRLLYSHTKFEAEE